MGVQSCIVHLGLLATLGCAGNQEAPAAPSSQPVAGPTATPNEQEERTHKHGVVNFPVSCEREARNHIETGLAHLHHMMYEQALSHFETAAERDAQCSMAHWGIAMASFRPLWHPTTSEDLARGKSAVAIAQQIGAPTERENGYIVAVAAFFSDPVPPAATPPEDHELRVNAWRQAQQALYETFPEDVDAAAFYALSEVAYAMTQFSPDRERDYSRELRAGAILERYLEDHPEHPGLFHYLIHAYDSPRLAPRAERVARAYDQLAPDVPHALHMPSHIFVRTGQWAEAAEWNERSAAAALRQPVGGVISLHYPHALDYMMYAYLQMGQEERAQQTLERVQAIEKVQDNFASAYGIAAPQARYHLERRNWSDAARLRPRYPAALEWEDYPAAEALFHYARGLGAARSGDLDAADEERVRIFELVSKLRESGDDYWASMTEALARAVEGWILYERGEPDRALSMMGGAADQESSMDKHPITPGEVFPVRELFGEMLLLEGHADHALAAFHASLARTPGRRNALAGVRHAQAAGLTGPGAEEAR